MRDGCILYEGQPHRRYPNVKWQGRQMGAHRRAWEQVHGPVPDGLYVCHKCDNPRCINVEHLFLGTPQANVDDMVAKGRRRAAPPGEAHHHARLTASQVADMRARYAAGGVTQ